MRATPGVPLPAGDGACYASGVRILPLGDSITDGLDDAGAYRVELWRELEAAGAHDLFVGSAQNGPPSLGERHHEGHPGFRIDHIAAHLDAWIAAAQPDLVLLMIGTNDVLQAYDLPHAPARLAALVDRILALRPTARVLLATLPPDAAAERQTLELNRAIPAIAAARPRVTLVDLHAALAGTPGLFPPGNCHPTLQGHRRIGELWAAAVLAATRRPDCWCLP